MPQIISDHVSKYMTFSNIFRLTIETQLTNGGFYQSHSYDGQTKTTNFDVTFDYVKPSHCSINDTCTSSDSSVMLDIGDNYRKTVSISCFCFFCTFFNHEHSMNIVSFLQFMNL